MPDRNGLMLPQPVVSVTEYLQGRHAFQTITDLKLLTFSVYDCLDFVYFLSRRGLFDRANHAWQMRVWNGKAVEIAQDMSTLTVAEFRLAQTHQIGRPLRQLIYDDALGQTMGVSAVMTALDIRKDRAHITATGEMQLDVDHQRHGQRIAEYESRAATDAAYRRSYEEDEIERKAATTHLFEQIADVRQGQIALPGGRDITLSEDDKDIIIEGLLKRLATPTVVRQDVPWEVRRGR